MKRLSGIDALRGLGILGMVFVHSATFYYGNITRLDYDNPPLVITVIGFLLMWAGLFGIISGLVHAYVSVKRLQAGQLTPRQLVLNYWIAGGYFLFLHYIYTQIFAPKLLDVVSGHHKQALLPGLLATGSFATWHVSRLYEASTLSAIGWSLIFTGPLLYLLLRRNGLERQRRNTLIIGGVATAIIVLSLIRIPFYPLTLQIIEQGNVLTATALGFLFNKNYPILPFCGFGIFGTLLGVWLAQSIRPLRIFWQGIGLGILWLSLGLVGILLLPDTLLERTIDLFWYMLTLMQLGIFLIMVMFALVGIDLVKGQWPLRAQKCLSPLRRTGMLTLSVFMLETLLSQSLALVADRVLPGWNMEINNCLIFGAFNALLWLLIPALWGLVNFRYSMEWITVRVYAWFRRASNKMQISEFL